MGLARRPVRESVRIFTWKWYTAFCILVHFVALLVHNVNDSRV